MVQLFILVLIFSFLRIVLERKKLATVDWTLSIGQYFDGCGIRIHIGCVVLTNMMWFHAA